MEIKKIRITPPVLIPVLIIIILTFLLYFYKGLFIAATVNGQPIWRLTLIRELEKQAGKKALDSLITQTLILQEAKKQNITVSETEIDQTIRQIEDNLTKQGQNLDQLLAAQGLTRSDLNEQIKLQKIVEKIPMKDVKVTDEEAKERFEKNKSSYPKNTKFEDVKDQLKKEMEQEKLSEKIQTWIKSLRDNAKINYFLQF